VKGVVANRAKGGAGSGEIYRGGGGGDEAEAVVELKLDVPFREVFKGPFNHVLSLTSFSVVVLGYYACDVHLGHMSM
jgi:hypothetical protein